MAIVKVGTYRNPPEDITDYEAIVSHLEAYTRQVGNQGMILTEWTNTTNAPKIAMGSYISHGGVLYVVEDEDYLLPSLSSDGTYYIRVAVSGETLALSYTTNIADYAWNAIYGGLYHSDESQVLPYEIVKNSALIDKYKMLNPWQNASTVTINYLGKILGRALSLTGDMSVTGAISGATVNTGQGATEVHLMNQNLRTTDSPTFATVNTGQGANELYAMNQNVRTTDSVYFANINPPVDNNDASMPSVGIGGFTFGFGSSGADVTLGSGGTYMVISFINNTTALNNCGRISGGTTLTNSSSSDLMVFAWRLA